MGQNQQNPFAEGVKKLKEGLKRDIRVFFPGTVKAVHLGGGMGPDLVDVQPTVNIQQFDQDIPAPLLHRVPLRHPGCKKAMIRLPIAVGDLVDIFISDRSIEEHQAGDGKTPVKPQSHRRHALDDAVCYPTGETTLNFGLDPAPGALQIITLPGTELFVGQAPGVDLVSAINLIHEILASVVIAQGTNPDPIKMTQLKQIASTLKGN